MEDPDIVINLLKKQRQKVEWIWDTVEKACENNNKGLLIGQLLRITDGSVRAVFKWLPGDKIENMKILSGFKIVLDDESCENIPTHDCNNQYQIDLNSYDLHKASNNETVIDGQARRITELKHELECATRAKYEAMNLVEKWRTRYEKCQK